MVEYLIDKNDVKKEAFLYFVRLIDSDFVPALSARVNIESWVEKVFQKARIIVAIDNKRVVGSIVFYVNKDENFGYVTFLGVLEEFRSQGVASYLLLKCFEELQDKRIPIVELHTNNPKAKDLYTKKGFEVITQEHLSEYKLIRYHLIKRL